MRLGPARPFHGQVRERTVFAWWPIRCDDGHLYWLESLRVEEHGVMLRDDRVTWKCFHAMPIGRSAGRGGGVGMARTKMEAWFFVGRDGVCFTRAPELPNPHPLRTAVVARDGLVCRYCGRRVRCHPLRGKPQRRDPRRLTMDHVLPRCRGGQNTVENLVVACRGCNNSKWYHRETPR